MHSVQKSEKGVTIRFDKKVSSQVVFAMVENCSEGRCECMSDGTKKKMKSMHIDQNANGVSLTIVGDVSEEEIEAALERSKILKEAAK